MICVGMDVHQKFTVICMFNPAAPAGKQMRIIKVATTPEALVSVLKPLEGHCRVAFEIGTQAQWIAAIVRPLAHEVQVANASRLPWLFRDGRKSDRIDAEKLATMLYLNQLPTVHLPAAEVSAWRALINHRRSLINRRTVIKNQIRSILRTFGLCCPHKSCWTRAGRSWLAEQTFDAVRQVMLRGLTHDLDALQERIEQIEVELDGIATRHPSVALLRSIPGIGARTAEAIVAFADDVKRFGRSKQFASYFGMTPTLDASAQCIRYGHISKRGPSVVRWVLVQAAHCIVRRQSALRKWFDRVYRGEKGRYKKAIVAVGRKVLTIAYRMMRDGTAYDDARVCARAA